MVRMFCTVEEAAEKLDANQEQIETLLRRGVLHEFRDGPHRLLKAVEVGALAAARKNTVEHRNRSPHQSPAAPLPPRRDRVSADGPASEIRLPRSATVAVRSPDGDVQRPKNTRRFQPQEPSGAKSFRRKPISNREPRPLPLAVGGRRDQRRATGQPQMEPQGLSLRQWLWAGLAQDRPATIALLAGFVLLALSALVAGLYMLREIV